MNYCDECVHKAVCSYKRIVQVFHEDLATYLEDYNRNHEGIDQCINLDGSAVSNTLRCKNYFKSTSLLRDFERHA
jgi:hypothetical protein